MQLAEKKKWSLGKIDLYLGDVSDAFLLCDLKKLKIPKHHVFIPKLL